MVVINNEAIKEITLQIESERNLDSAGGYIYEYIRNKNTYDNLSFALKSIKEDLKEILSYYPEDFYFGQIHFSILNEVFKELGWQVVYDTIVTVGVDYKVVIDIPNKDFYYQLSCSWYNPKNHLRKCYEAKGNNC